MPTLAAIPSFVRQCLGACALATFATLAWAQEPAIATGQSIGFLGDSITQQGAGLPSGYVNLVISGLAANDIKVKAYPAGIGGHKSNQMLERLNKDVLSKKPTWMTLSCGVNDVWHGANGVPLDAYKTNITALVDQAQAAGVKVMILTATMIMEDPANDQNKKLAPYNEFLVKLAAEKKCLLADLNALMQAEVAKDKADPAGKLLPITGDGVHMALRGNLMMATGVLRAFGLDDAAIAKARAAWLDVKDAVEAGTRRRMDIRTYERLAEIAHQRGCSLDALLDREFAAAIDALLKPAPAAAKP